MIGKIKARVLMKRNVVFFNCSFCRDIFKGRIIRYHEFFTPATDHQIIGIAKLSFDKFAMTLIKIMVTTVGALRKVKCHRNLLFAILKTRKF